MFGLEGVIQDLVANSLGPFLDISKEQLRVSLFSGAWHALHRAWKACATAAATLPPPSRQSA